MAGMAVAFASLLAGSNVLGQSQPPPANDETKKQANDHRTSLHQEIVLKASPARVYQVLLDSEQFAACTGLPAKIDSRKGGTFSTFGGLIEGLSVELVTNRRIVQAWRPTHWDADVYSIVKFELQPRDTETLVVLDHTGFPEGEFDHLNSGWPIRYWNPLKKFLAKV